MKTLSTLLLFVMLALNAVAQYAPPAGQEGSTAIYVDSTVFVDWATQCSLQRGWMNIADTSIGKSSYGTANAAIGKADNNVVSLGDGGMATLYFTKPVANGDGFDLAIFENAFTDEFLELAFVEVSSDSINFYRFPSVSHTQTNTQVETFGTLNAIDIHNLAGKYRAFYGVPFDLEELKDSIELDVNHIVAVRVIDVTGSLDSNHCSYDSKGNKINDPWPTPFETGGFDLDAVGVIHNNATAIQQNSITNVTVWPNPCRNFLEVSEAVKKLSVFDVSGKLLMSVDRINDKRVDFSALPKGMLLVKTESNHHQHHIFKVIRL
ncbi:MAG: T9SS C-terminal target domain-containing protein [Bacteroidetes bacterium]|nr:MAG: T9SS C-terminal target domain-containing protein [Bacteroidota bacterium]